MTIVSHRVFLWVLLALAFLAQADGQAPLGESEIRSVAVCLSERGYKVYGAAWCPACHRQLALFGEASRELAYVSCPDTLGECEKKMIRFLPTWISPVGTRHVGLHAPWEIGQIAGCK